jgi:ATP-dependent Clp protease ATP-binding subunit ClpB
MNLDRFTHKAQEVLQKTAQSARTEGHPEVTPEHLADALLQQEGGVVPALLERPARPRRMSRSSSRSFRTSRARTPSRASPPLS